MDEYKPPIINEGKRVVFPSRGKGVSVYINHENKKTVYLNNVDFWGIENGFLFGKEFLFAPSFWKEFFCPNSPKNSNVISVTDTIVLIPKRHAPPYTDYEEYYPADVDWTVIDDHLLIHGNIYAPGHWCGVYKQYKLGE